MKMFPTARLWSAALLLTAAAPVVGLAQDVKSPGVQSPTVALNGARGPWVSARESRVPLLRRTVALRLSNASLRTALDAVARSAGFSVAYGEDVLRSAMRVTLRVDKLPLIDALAAILDGTGLDAFVSIRGDALLVGPALDAAGPQAGTIVGRVTDAKTGSGIDHAEVFLDNTRWHTATDTGGRYHFVAADTGHYTLTVRRLGYAKQSRAVVVREGQTDTADVALEPVAARLQELVTTATGRRRRVDIANDVTTITADSVMQTQPVRSVTDLLETRVPGLTVQHTSGAPGDPSRLRLRGIGSPLRNNDPIVIVDGVRFYSQQSANRSANLAAKPLTGSGAQATDSVSNRGVHIAPSPLDYLDPNMIETIEVLKGPSAATLYGQDAANGVIVITTKRGKAGPTQWTVNLEQGRTQIEGDYPELVYRWGHVLYDKVPVNCPITNVTTYSYGPTTKNFPCVGDSVRSFQLLNDPALTVLDQGHRSTLSLGVSGGVPALTYAVTGSYGDEVGLVKLPTYGADQYQALFGSPPPDWMRRPQDFKRWGVTSTVAAQLGAAATVTLMANLSRSEQQKSTLQDQLGTLMTTYLDRVSQTYYSYDPVQGVTAIGNPLQDYYLRATDQATEFTNSVTLSWHPHSWLTVAADAGFNLIHRADEEFFPRGPANTIATSVSAPDTTGYVSDGQGSSFLSTANLRASALKALGGFQFQFAAGANYAGTSSSDVANATYNLLPGSSLQGTSVTFLRRAEQTDATFGWYVEPSVGNSRFNFTSGLRIDGSGSHGANGGGPSLPTFPKLGFSYLLSDEPWFPLKTLVQSLRVRVAYGRASRQADVKDRLRLYTAPGQVFADSQFGTGVQLLTLGNTEVRPERETELEGGFDTDLFDSRLTLSVSGYRKTTDDALLNVPVAPSIYGYGYGTNSGLLLTIMKNIGVLRNTGLEVRMGAQLLRSALVRWDTQLQLSQNRNVVVKLAPGVGSFYSNPTGNFQGGIRVAPGYPLFGRWARPILGYADANGDGVLEREEIQLGDTAVYVGSTIPNFEANLSTSISFWRGAVKVNAAVSFQDGLSQRNDLARQLGLFSTGRQGPTASLADQAARADLTVNQLVTGGPAVATTDYNWIQTVSTTRFSSLAVSYTVPVAVARRLGARSLSVALQGENLGLWTSYRGLDPNVNDFGTGNDVTDSGVLPQPRTWQLRVSANY